MTPRTPPKALEPLPRFLRRIGKRDVTPGGSYALERALLRLHAPHGETVHLISPLRGGEEGKHIAEALLAGNQAGPRNLSVSESFPMLKPSESLDALTPASYGFLCLEAILTWMNDDAALATLSLARRVLKPGGRIALHELIWRQPPPEALASTMDNIWREKIFPRRAGEYWRLLEAAGFQSVANEIGVLAWFRARALARDEGHEDAMARLSATILDSEDRARLTQLREHLATYERFYGYGVFDASRL